MTAQAKVSGAEPIPRTRTTKSRGRPLGAKAQAIRQATFALLDEYDVMTVRQVFYALTVRGVVPKDQNDGYRPVQEQLLRMRREGKLPWSFIADGTRWQRKPESWGSHEDALRQTARTYRRNLWRAQNVRLEIWLEKDALAGVVEEATFKWDVPLMVSRGQASDTFVHAAACTARDAWEQAGIETVVYALYDADRSGRVAADKIEEKLRIYSDDTPFSFDLLAVTDEQIEAWALPTRPAKEDASEIAVELDAIPPEKLISLVETAIISHIDAEAWNQELAAEKSEREILTTIATGASL